MYLCAECGAKFEEPATNYDLVPYGMGNARYEFYVCPNCKSDEIDEIIECVECGEPTNEDTNYSGYCKKCIYSHCNSPLTVFDFSVDSHPNDISDFALACLGEKGINEILREYFCEIDKTCPDRFTKERIDYIDECLVDIGEWMAKHNGS